MKFNSRLLWLALLIITVRSESSGQSAQQEPWKENQLMPPAELAAMINNPDTKKPVIFCIGPNAIVKGSVDIGATKEKENLKKLKEEVSKLSKDAPIVIYCGCCPFERCPNIRPAFQLLSEMKFTNHKLLNLPTNIKVDWINKGYPKSN